MPICSNYQTLRFPRATVTLTVKAEYLGELETTLEFWSCVKSHDSVSLSQHFLWCFVARLVTNGYAFSSSLNLLNIRTWHPNSEVKEIVSWDFKMLVFFLSNTSPEVTDSCSKLFCQRLQIHWDILFSMHRKHSLVGTQRIINLEDSWLSSVIDTNYSKLGVIDTFKTVKTNFLHNLSSWLGIDIQHSHHES